MANELTRSQQSVCDYPYKAASTLKVIAGPGSGKTFTLLHKVHHLVVTKQVRPDEILILSLTNKAVDNINDKLLGVFEEMNAGELPPSEVQEVVDQISVFTIHGLANKLVTEHEGVVNIIEDNGWRGLLKLISSDYWGNKQIRSPTAKNLEKILKAYKSSIDETHDKTLKDIVKIMDDCNVLTNDDLILKASTYLEKGDELGLEFLNTVKHKYKVVLIDEYQDLYPTLLPVITGVSRGKQLILFGDTNQSIYEFLGSNKKVVAQLDKVHPPDSNETMHLYDNFRSTPEIVDAVQKIKAHPTNADSQIDVIVKQPSCVSPLAYTFNNDSDQFDFLLCEIAKLVCTGTKLSDIAILTRTNAQIKYISEFFQNYQIPFHKMTSQPDWLLDTRIQFIIDLIKVIVLTSHNNLKEHSDSINSSRATDFSIIITLSALRGVGPKTIQTLYSASLESGLPLWEYITTVDISKWPNGITNKKKVLQYSEILTPLIENDSLWKAQSPMEILELISPIVVSLDYSAIEDMSVKDNDSLEVNLNEMYEVLKLCAKEKRPEVSLIESFLETFFDKSAKYHHSKLLQESTGTGKVNISTIHSSKGLEFPVVMVVCPVNEAFSIDDNTLYVGSTRAKNLLYWINVKHKSISPRVDPQLFSNEHFWNYYNRDLGRSVDNIPRILAGNLKRYKSLETKFGLRNYSTLSRVSLRAVGLCKYVL